MVIRSTARACKLLSIANLRFGINFMVNEMILLFLLTKKHDSEENIDHFMNKHPQALKMRHHVAYSFLKGYAFRNSLMLKIQRKTKEFHFMDHSEYYQIKAELTEYSLSGNELPIVYDYVEDTDLDILIQCLGVTHNIIRYYPMSRHLNSVKMMDFLKVNMPTDER